MHTDVPSFGDSAMTSLSAFDPLAAPVIDHGAVHRTVLPNGLTVLVHCDGSAPVVAVVTYVKAGYFDETDDVVGIAHVLEHMFFKGTERRGVGEIAKETKASGGYLNAHTIYDHTSYYTVLPASGLAAGLDVQADAYANSVIDREELAKELEVIIQEAKRKSDNPGAVAVETLYELLHQRHRMRRWRIGREARLRALTRDDLVRFYRNFYRPRNTILSIVGDVGIDETLRQVERLYGTIPDAPIARVPGPAELPQRELRYREWGGDIAQTQLLFGWHTPGTLHADTPLLDLAASVLGAGRASRLYRAVRERQLAASVSAFNYTPTELGVFGAHAETPPHTALDAARAIWGQVRTIREDGIGVHELERARRVFESRWIRRLETMEGKASYLAEWEALGDWRLGDRYLEHLITATPEQVTAAVGQHLDPAYAAVVVYRPETSPEIAADAEAMRHAMDSAPPAPLPASTSRPATPVLTREPRVTLETEEAGVQVYRGPRDVPILLRPKRGAPIVHIGVFASGGAIDELATHAGLTMLMARTAIKGTSRRNATQLAEDAELLGGTIGVSIGAESFGWTIAVPVKHTVAALELLADVVQRPIMNPDALEIERAVAVSGVKLLRDDMYRYPLRLALQAAFGAHQYGTPVTGTEDSLREITAEQLREWHRARVLGTSTMVGVVGDVDSDGIAAVAAREFSELSAGVVATRTAPAWPNSGAMVVERRDKAQTALALAFPSPDLRDPARYTASLIAVIASGLGGRFFDELRDRRSLAYTVHAFAAERQLAGLFVSYIATSPEQEDVARQGLLEEFAKLREQPVRDDELARAKRYAVGSDAIRQQSGGAVLSDVIDAWLVGTGLSELEAFEERIEAVTPLAVRELARRYFDESKRVEGVVRGVGKPV